MKRILKVIILFVIGVIGCQGSTGPQGSQGPPGNQGIQGAQGITGPTGPQGSLGVPCLSCVTTASLQDGAVTSSKITSEAIISPLLAQGAVTSGTIFSGAILSRHLADGAVTSTAIMANAIGTSHLADGSVTSAKVALSYTDVAASSNLALTQTPTIVPGTLIAQIFTSTQVLWGSFYAFVCPDDIGGGGTPASQCRLYVDNSPIGPSAGVRLGGYPQCATLSAPFELLLSAGAHSLDLRCWNDTTTTGRVYASMGAGYTYILFSP